MARLRGRFTSARSKPQAAGNHPTREEIEQRAFQIYRERGGGPGQAMDDWLQAERELLEKYGKVVTMGKAQGA